MITRAEHLFAQKKAAELINDSGICTSKFENSAIEVADFGLGNLFREGAQILTLIQTNRISVKILALFPFQTEPEHWHPDNDENPGKEETIRVVKGILYLYLEGPDNMLLGKVPEGKQSVYTCRHELIMNVNDQITIQPGSKHWFMAGDEEAVFYSFSTVARDNLDKFTDPEIIRETKILEEQF